MKTMIDYHEAIKEMHKGNVAGETVDPRAWKPEKNTYRKEIKSKLGYSRIGLGNV